MKFLIDECMHTSLVQVANGEGHEAYHVAHLGRAGTKDGQLMPTIIQEDYTFVTNNAADFRELYQAEDLHAGLIIVVPQVRPEIQRQLFQAVLDELGGHELVNEVMEVDLDEDQAVFDRYPMPAA